MGFATLKAVTARGNVMLELRPNCERRDIDLPAASRDARICSFKCTFCATCAEQHLQGHCPNCGGELVRRPIRPAAKLLTHPVKARTA